MSVEQDIIEAPKTDFYLKLVSEADMPTALAAFYRQDTIAPEGDHDISP